MSYIEHKGIHHIDGTYRITIYGFPLVVYGVSDQTGRFHPVCYMITSHETQEDFEYFFQGINDLCNEMGLEYDPEYIMQDACPASRSAILEFFPDVIVLMCYFHVKKNIKDNCKNKLENEVWAELQADLKNIHMSHNLENFEENKKIFKNKYQKEYPEVYDYCATWLEGDWSNWQIYCNKPGQANSNSNIESFNNVIKIDMSRKKLTMKAAITAIFEQIVY
jgi:hypothetical protein